MASNCNRNRTNGGGVVSALVQSAKVAAPAWVRGQAHKASSRREGGVAANALTPKISPAKVFRRAKKTLPPAMVQTLRAWGLGTFMHHSVAQECNIADVQVMYQCIHYIKANGLLIEGVFRISGDSKAVNEGLSLLKMLTCSLDALERADCSVHDVSSMLKRTAMNSETPIVSYVHYAKLVHVGKPAAKSSVSEEGVGEGGPQPTTMSPSTLTWRRYLTGFVASLPPRNSRLLGLLLNVLYVVASTKENMMSARALATVFAPTIFRAPPKLPLERVLKDTPIMIEAMRILIENAGLDPYPELNSKDLVRQPTD